MNRITLLCISLMTLGACSESSKTPATPDSPEVETIETKEEPQLVGGWAETEIDSDVKRVVDYVHAQMDNPREVKTINWAKSQVVKGVNYEVNYTLADDTEWTATVYRDLDGSFEILQAPESNQ